MVRVYIRKTNRQSWNQDAMALAIQQVVEGKMGYKAASEAFNVPKSTLRGRVNKVRKNKLTPELASEKIFLGRYDTVFSENQEDELVRCVLLMEGRLFTLTYIDVRRMAFELAEKNGLNHSFNKQQKIAGKDWLYGFLARHPELCLRSRRKTMSRAKGFNKVTVGKFYDLLGSIYKNHRVSPEDIYAVDEIGILAVPNKPPKLIALRDKKQVGGLSSSDPGILVTLETCMSASGNFMPLMFVFPREMEETMLMDDAPPGSFTCYNESGWNDKDAFLIWFKRFIEFSNPSPDKPVLLLLDGCKSFTKSLDIIQLAREKNVIFLCFPPHTSHRLHPLDVSFTCPFSTYYEQEVRQWLIENPGRDVTIYQIGKLLNGAYKKAATIETAIKGFGETGIYPFDSSIFPDHMFAPSETISTSVTEELESSASGGELDEVDSKPPTSRGAADESEPQPSTSAGSSAQMMRWLDPRLLLEQHLLLQQTASQEENKCSSNSNATPIIHFCRISPTSDDVVPQPSSSV